MPSNDMESQTHSIASTPTVTCVPSWGTWPGIADLPRMKSAAPHASRTPSASVNMGGNPQFSGTSVRREQPWRPLPRKGLRGSRPNRVCYQKKERILFTWKPPALPSLTNSAALTNESAWDTQADCVILLSRLPWWMTDCDIRDAGSSYGQIRAVRIIGDPTTGISTGLGLVEFTHQTAALTAFGDNGACWDASRQGKEPGEVQVHRVSGILLQQIYGSPADTAPSNCPVHWSFGTFLDDSTMRNLYRTANVLLPKYLATSPSAPSDAPEPNDVKAARPTDKRAVTEITPLGFRFPFAAAAVVAGVLREQLKTIQANKEDSSSGIKRARTSDVHSPHTNSGIMALHESLDSLDSIDSIHVPYWGSPLHPPIRLPPAKQMGKMRYDIPSLQGGYWKSVSPTHPCNPEPTVMHPSHHHPPGAYAVPHPARPVWNPYTTSSVPLTATPGAASVQHDPHRPLPTVPYMRHTGMPQQHYASLR